VTTIQIKTEWFGDKIEAQIVLANVAVVKEATEYILGETNNVAPLDEGHLIRSGDTDIEVIGNHVNGSVFYDTPYARRLHEHPEYNFQNGRKGKYLEGTLKANKEKLLAFFVAKYKNLFKSSIGGGMR
jgi:hypothetical protein